ncbi:MULTISPECIES: bifunctional isocitrate dehydrogenase kinase/phosphatase [unclassified Colwellia]|uniref:bifunctional isocitrate dehydrogenase kinase/phosphatase n=1 Tax=unclassified Colwellia TaxID=196834 RepID=UPI0015F757A2|nr:MULTISPECIES: bifunctional isocitrate dehydrogenase kinase/phosphatase [unclassified Colwellia]MBA6337213.1 bifunctional isocitrate dehydrogenase kinase/phosphatase [Colwellia sp. BRX8-7]MBA6347722.1 bifunctional isocitrate dehydrogenase kinase/phosphatase [Colwellia sp. BRX8-9]MBA6357874.1 bifunctional isocitrate dehydrogenase kinase/phosphatase [Colwellia sp. BRX8-3]MBA6360439.1 bifunctional isocitrate dehydrogenase kinase/phosphatase [Colwellia sp. BRX8-6]MBA6368770.1 bifunctional isocit
MNNIAFALAKTILNGFERHIYLFSEITQSAKKRFELCQWQAVQDAAKSRTDFYDKRVEETLETIKKDFFVSNLDELLWQNVKVSYVDLLKEHHQPELAESFYNSIFCHLFERKYYHNAFIFVKSTVEKIENIASPVIYTRYLPSELGLEQTIAAIMNNANFNIPFVNLERDMKSLIKSFRVQAHKTRYKLSELKFDILDFIFYRNKGAYIIGRVISPGGETPFIVPIVNNEKEGKAAGLYIDALLTEGANMAVVFGFARAYFFVDCQHPFALVQFLKRLIPHKTLADLYSAIGFHKQGKTQFYRDFLNHLDASDDKFELAAGIKGMVMSVFTLPSYPYVFKIIKDKFAPSKTMTKQEVKGKYRLVKLHDRVGRMADTMEYSEVAFPKDRFSEELLTELLNVAQSIIRFEDELIIIKHLYIERRMTPLNLYLAKASDEEIEEAMYGYGSAIKQLIAANIFPGDMLLKNFGVTRHGRVIFYDYDEITYMDEVNFRVKPEAITEEQIYAAEPWYSVAPGDMFPEEIATFALANKKYRNAFLLHHADLLEASFWQQCQKSVATGKFEDVFPYPEALRFCNN